jgi:DNA polymerase III beta subunit, C-terminal domain
VQLNSEEFEDVIRRVSLLADDRMRGVRFGLERDHLEVSASSPEYGEAKERQHLGESAFRSKLTQTVSKISHSDTVLTQGNSSAGKAAKKQRSPDVLCQNPRTYCKEQTVHARVARVTRVAFMLV